MHTLCIHKHTTIKHTYVSGHPSTGILIDFYMHADTRPLNIFIFM